MSWSDWLWGSSKEKGRSSVGSQDPVGSLDPNLRKYLERETPKTVSKPNNQESERPSYTDQLSAPSKASSNSTNTASTQPSDSDKPHVPPESLFQDGRYAHLWKTYRPQAELENSVKTPQEKVQDIVDTYKIRKVAISKAALENCANEQIAVTECYLHGSWSDVSTMCRTQNRAMDRCYTTQGKFLRALGYLSGVERSADEEERIQMHADTLYHRMMEQERRDEERKKAGEEVQSAVSTGPVEEAQESLSKGGFADALKVRMKAIGIAEQTQVGTRENGMPLTFKDLSAEKQAVVLERLKDKSPEEKALEVQAISAEMAASEGYLKRILPVYEEERRQREERREQGRETLGDRIKSAWGWDGPRRG
ncbi:hypothetical protein EV356DRAFT_452528 [Viridothelium virens]|uniref:Autophagy protein n=1 Tax=Viridothelium virens TaxID=1048519 RepID=A0A6A6H030_VIRVR|nr:hypothetical protein EV356DRAFT_452528 [Viridothelium virens]